MGVAVLLAVMLFLSTEPRPASAGVTVNFAGGVLTIGVTGGGAVTITDEGPP